MPDHRITIRKAQPADAEKLLALKRSYIENTTSIPLYLEECRTNPYEERQLIKRYIAEANSILLVAEHDGQLIGNLDLTGNQRKKLYHTAMLGMGVAYTWHGKGIGTLLMRAALEWAHANSYIKIIWLEVYSTNIAGIKLYQNFKFECCGIMKNFFQETIISDKISMIFYVNGH